MPTDEPFPEAAGRRSLHTAGRLPLADFHHARALMIRSRGRKILLVLGVVGVFVILMVAVAVSARSYSTAASNRILIAVLVIYPLLVALPAVVFRWRVRRLWRQELGVFAASESTIDDDGIATRAEASAIAVQCGWDAFTGYRASDRVVVLFFKGGGYLITSRSKFSHPGDWEAFQSLVAEKIGHGDNR